MSLTPGQQAVANNNLLTILFQMDRITETSRLFKARLACDLCGFLITATGLYYPSQKFWKKLQTVISLSKFKISTGKFRT